MFGFESIEKAGEKAKGLFGKIFSDEALKKAAEISLKHDYEWD